MSAKTKSDMRWEQGRRLYNAVCPTLPTPSHVVVLMYCWFHASGRECRFSVAHCQIAAGTRLSYERVRKIVKDLIEGGVLATLEDSAGRGHAPKRVITGMAYQKRVVTHDHHSKEMAFGGQVKGGHPQPP